MYLCNSKGSACALPFFSLQSSQQPPKPQKGAFRVRMALQKGHTWNVIRPKRAAKCGPFRIVIRAEREQDRTFTDDSE